MKRGEIWTAAAGEPFSNKPAPVLIVQRDIAIPVHQSIIVCRITSNIAELPFMRLRIVPDENNGLMIESDVMADKVLTLKKTKLAQRIGTITQDEAERLDALLLFWMGL